jgi:hypothetical protein
VPKRVGHDAAVGEMMAVLVEHGMLLESARGPIPNVAELVAGEPVSGSWWSHPRSHDIFEAINVLADSPDVVRLRLVRGKVTLVHSRLWPALARLEDRFPASALAAIIQEHTESGAHRTTSVPFADWLPPRVRHAGAQLTEAQALGHLPEPLRPTAPADPPKPTDGPHRRPT